MNTDYHEEAAHQIPIKNNVDVIVIGAGPAGFAAAINAAREGAKTLLIEQTSALGGVATTGLMSHWTGYVIGGFYEEILDESSDCFKDDGTKLGNFNTINPEKLKTILMKLAADAGVIIRLYTFVCDVIMKENQAVGVITESKSGREAHYAKIMIDASGDGDIAFKAGVPFKKGRNSDGKMQPMTLMFKIAGVDYKEAVFPGGFEDNIIIPKGKIQDLGKSNLPSPAGHVLLYPSTLPGIVTVNMTNCTDVDGTNTDDLTKAEIQCRTQIDPIIQFLRENVPGYQNCFIISSASVIGVRDTRRMEGLYELTEYDILEAKIFDDWVVGQAHFNFDVHNIEGAGLDKTGVQRKFDQQKPYTIPYRCFIPKRIDNLYFAGRNISGTHLALSNYRAMPICLQMGEAIGIAAALCVRLNLKPRELPVNEIQAKLKERNVKPRNN